MMQRHYRELFEALCEYVTQHPHPRLAQFEPALRNWGDTCRDVEASRLPVTDLLEAALADCDTRARGLLRAVAEHHHRLRWEQSYRRQDGLVPDAMLDAYGFAEFSGLHGPLISERIRCGVAIWGPDIDYPRHHHQAEEAYLLLSGSMQFQFDDDSPLHFGRGDAVVVDSDRRHGFRTGAGPLVVCYLWQAGDLLQISRFN